MRLVGDQTRGDRVQVVHARMPFVCVNVKKREGPGGACMLVQAERVLGAGFGQGQAQDLPQNCIGHLLLSRFPGHA
jgi:hypothetical protein